MASRRPDQADRLREDVHGVHQEAGQWTASQLSDTGSGTRLVKRVLALHTAVTAIGAWSRVSTAEAS